MSNASLDLGPTFIDHCRVLIMKKVILKTPVGLAVALASSQLFAWHKVSATPNRLHATALEDRGDVRRRCVAIALPMARVEIQIVLLTYIAFGQGRVRLSARWHQRREDGVAASRENLIGKQRVVRAGARQSDCADCVSH